MNRTTLTLMALWALAAAGAVRAQAPASPPTPTTAPQGTAQAEAGSPVQLTEPAKAPATAKSTQTAPPSASAAPKGPAGVARGVKGTDTLELGTTEISGNRELPKVLYVVPWRRPEIGDAVGRPPNSLVEEALTPVDREVFRRQNRYYATLQAGAAPAKSQPAAAGGASAHAAPKDER